MLATEIIHPLEIVQPDIGAAVLWDVHEIDQIGGGKKDFPEKQTPAGCSRGGFCLSRKATPYFRTISVNG
jgi:hypothetical protein